MNDPRSLGLDRRSLLRLAGWGCLTLALPPVFSSCAAPAPGGDLVASSVGRRPAAPLAASTLAPFGYRLADAAAPTGNLIMSGYSIAVVLAMIANGAAGPTAEEFTTLLGSPVAALNEEFNTLSQAVAAPGAKVAVTVANSLWSQRGFSWRQAFLDTLAAYYGAGVRQVDFTDTAAAVAAINAWAKDQTRGMIPEVLTPDQVSPDTRMALANAIHLKGSWARQFDPALTSPQPFTRSDGRTVSASMMTQDGTLPWLEADDWEATALPFEGGDWALVLALPDKGAGQSLAALTAKRGFEEVVTAPAASVRVQVPRWTAAGDFDLKAPLEALGLRLAFNPDAADFTGMTDAERLFLGFIIHKARIRVDETGAEAAAVTVGGMQATGMPTEPHVLRLDRTFCYALVHVPTKAVLFLGRVDDPTREG